MKIGILEAGRPPEELASFGSYAEMLENFVRRAADTDEFSFKVYAVMDGEFPDSAQDCDGWMITGSRNGVYDKLPWMEPLQTLIREIHAAQRPLFGICFGHQIIAAAMGGEVVKSDKGWGVGLHDYQLAAQTPDWLQTDKNKLTLNAMHQDQVVSIPPSAQVLAGSAFCEYAALLYGDSMVSFQGHPEFATDYERALLKLRQTALIPDELAEPALQRLSQPGEKDDGQLVSDWAVEFFRRHNNS
ncbi:MAG: gamma-glutamyl-gamma-aminobutyrate hydrolase family protein [Thiolinea sp.]